MSVQTAKKVAWKNYKVAVPWDTDKQTCYPPPGECTLTYVFKAVVDKGSGHVGLFYLLHLMQAAFLDFAQVC